MWIFFWMISPIVVTSQNSFSQTIKIIFTQGYTMLYSVWWSYHQGHRFEESIVCMPAERISLEERFYGKLSALCLCVCYAWLLLFQCWFSFHPGVDNMIIWVNGILVVEAESIEIEGNSGWLSSTRHQGGRDARHGKGATYVSCCWEWHILLLLVGRFVLSSLTNQWGSYKRYTHDRKQWFTKYTATPAMFKGYIKMLCSTWKTNIKLKVPLHYR